MPKTKDRVTGVAGSAKPYVERALRDDELRDHVKQAYSAAKQIYEELIAPRGLVGVAHKVAADSDIQDNLRTAIDELRQAANRLQGRPQSEHRGGRNLLLLAGVAAGLLFNPVTGPQTRRWLAAKVFGGSDEFGYDAGSNGSTAGTPG